MRIALVSTEVGGIHNGGIGTYVIEAAHALSGAGHEVWLVTYLPDSSSSEVIEQLPGFARVLFVEDCPSATDPIRFGLARVPLRFAQLAHEMLRDAGVAFDLIEFADYGANGAVAVAEQRLFGSHGDAVVTANSAFANLRLLAAQRKYTHLWPERTRSRSARARNHTHGASCAFAVAQFA